MTVPFIFMKFPCRFNIDFDILCWFSFNEIVPDFQILNNYSQMPLMEIRVGKAYRWACLRNQYSMLFAPLLSMYFLKQSFVWYQWSWNRIFRRLQYLPRFFYRFKCQQNFPIFFSKLPILYWSGYIGFNRCLIWVSKSDMPNQKCDCLWKWMIPMIE